jgi:creatinine amidohydrolase
MPNPGRKAWQELTTDEVASLDPATIAVLPVGAIEQHGPHLPLGVDCLINDGVLARVQQRLPGELPVLFLPLLPVGKSNEHAAFPGTLTLSAETLIRVWTEIGESIARAGLRKLVLFNSHGGQPQIAEIVATDLRARLKMLVVTADSWKLGLPPGLFPDSELTHGIHGGGLETSLMLHLRPDLVREAERRNFASRSIEIEQRYQTLRAVGSGISFGWQTQDLNSAGACGDALDADAERGQQILEAMADGFIALLRDVHRFPLAELRDRD